MSKTFTRFLLLMLGVFALLAFSAIAEDSTKVKAEEKAAHDFVGHKKCGSKACHKDNHTSWLETKHAKAYDLLSDEEKQKPECVTCHTTGTTAKGVLLEGVQCEACHGAGKDYKSLKIMSKKKWKADPEKQKAMAIKAGLIIPTEENCKRCHTKEGNPNFTEFDFEKSKGLVHPVAEAESK